MESGIGFNSFWAAEGAKLGVSVSQLARVTAEHKGAYEISSGEQRFRATVTGKTMLKAAGREDYPVVGDWVVINQDDNDTKTISAILPRQTLLRKKHSGRDESQPIAANIDVIFVVESLDRDFNLNRLDRYLVLARDSGAKPVFILNKADLKTPSELEDILRRLKQRFPDIDTITTSMVNENGLSELNATLKSDQTYCLVGSSGVGKSTILNQLIGNNDIKTRTTSEKTGRGQHTTTARQMYQLANGAIIIDNPGSREVGLVNLAEAVDDVFDVVSTLAANCKFADCQHDNEPGCAVQAAPRTGSLDAAQFANYQKLRQETAHYEMSEYERRQKDRRFGQFLKKAKKDLE